MIPVDRSMWIDHINTHPAEGQSTPVQARARNARQGRGIDPNWSKSASREAPRSPPGLLVRHILRREPRQGGVRVSSIALFNRILVAQIMPIVVARHIGSHIRTELEFQGTGGNSCYRLDW